MLWRDATQKKLEKNVDIEAEVMYIEHVQNKYKNIKGWVDMNLTELRLNCAEKQKRGLHFIIASVFIWCLVLVVHLTDFTIVTKNLMTFCITTLMLPLAFVISKGLGVNFQNKDNPLTNLGILFSVNQMPYILIAMWVYQAVPEKMLMIVAMIFGAHLMPYGWLYQSKSYLVLSALIPIVALIISLNYPPSVLAGIMVMIEIVFCIALIAEEDASKLKSN
jgi:hypothetical protein